jgi:queuine tRNA-ribosyltransferase
VGIRIEILAEAASGARAGVLHLRSGIVETPTFMPVATHAHVRHLSLTEVEASGARICLANTYHLMERPGAAAIERAGGIHRFMGWQRGVLTDSGGFQIFSLPSVIDEAGARIGARLLTPETSLAAQRAIGADIMMALDVCLPSTADEATTRAAMERTHRWAARSLAARGDTEQALFGIVQGGVFARLREESARVLGEMPFDGLAIGGLAVGEARDDLYETTLQTAPLLARDRPRYLMGVGTPSDLVEAVNAGVDMFDCILPTMMAEQGYAYTFEGPLRLTRQAFREDAAPLDTTCACPVCQRHSRAYLHHLAHGGHALAARLLAEHNLWHYQALMRRMRRAIVAGQWASEYRALRDALGSKKEPRRVPGRSSGAFELVSLATGASAVRHKASGEVMHPIGPWQEANALYVEQVGLGSLLASGRRVRILDVGLGAGTNAVAALSCAKATAALESTAAIEIVSLERDLDALRLALSDGEGFPFLDPWRSACDALLERGVWEGAAAAWRVISGDARETIDRALGAFDLVYFDPFSPKTNPALWTVDFARRLRDRCAPDARVVTYSAATPTRVMFLLAGFAVGQGAATGTRQETTIAALDRGALADPLGSRWLERWRRSTARGAHDVPFSAEVERTIAAHPQFR